VREVPEEVLKAFQKQQAEDAAWKAKYGHVRMPVHTEFNGQRFVAVYGTLHWGGFKTFVDFLLEFIRRVLGREWLEVELGKPVDRRHVIMHWKEAFEAFQRRSAPAKDGLFEGLPDGPSMAYLSLAYDLYVVSDNNALLDRLVARLRHADQFQGVRYELAVAATMFRAGFEIEYDDDGDGSTQHPEFIAIHKESGERVAVEAKSRHRDGILGRTGDPKPLEDFRLGIGQLLGRALKKDPDPPYLIFIDGNMPPEFAESVAWVAEAEQAVKQTKAVGRPYNALFVTHWPHHYGKVGAPDPKKLYWMSWTQPAPRPMKNAGLLEEIRLAVARYGNIPSFVFRDQDRE
jgi:hypothetical protein